MNKTGIEYLTHQWSPVTGCTPVSAGCQNCWARRMHERGLWGKQPFSEVTLHPGRLDDPRKRRKSARIGVSFMGDLFHEKVPDEFIARVFATMRRSPKCTFLLLTKRPGRMRDWLCRCANGGGLGWITHNGTEPERAYQGTGIVVGDDDKWPLPNVWLGVSVENQQTADERIPLLLQTPAALRYVSIEPMLGPIRLKQQNPDGFWPPNVEQPDIAWLRHKDWPDDYQYWTAGLDWVICGGESGPGARPCDANWIRAIVQQCKAASVPCFVKQMGSRGFYRDESPSVGPEVYPISTPEQMELAAEALGEELKHYHGFSGVGKNMDEWPEDLRVREIPEAHP